MLQEDKKTILIADDTPENVDILRELLSEYKLVIAINGRIALKIAEAEPNIDLILLDIMMPELNGYQACEILKQNKKTKDIPIIFITALTNTESLVKSFELGAVDYITKPFNPAEVKKRVETHLALRSYQRFLEHMNTILDKKVQQRTKELQTLNNELTEAKNKAEEINKLKSFFINNVSHELRTPLISILGFSELMANESENLEHRDFSQKIFESGRRLEKTLNDIISLTELEKKKMEITFHPVDVKETIYEAIFNFDRLAKRKGLLFNLSFNFDELEFSTDPNLMQYLLFNIVDNAVKFTNEGKIDVAINVSKVDFDSYLIIKVTDTGVGISQDKLDTLFSSFRQESEGYSRKFEGLGIGLTVAKQIIDILKGTISIKSEVNRGTEVTLKFLMENEDDVTQKINNAKQLLDEQFTFDEPTKPLVLIVEDNYNNSLLLKKMLQNDYCVDEAASGITAVAMAQTKLYDIVLMDINLTPGIDGIEALKRIRELPHYTTTPVIAVTAFANSNERSKYINFGFDDFQQKPIQKDSFMLLLKQYVE